MPENDGSQSDESRQRILDPHRQEEQAKARQEGEAWLADRGIAVRPDDGYDDVVELQDALERFEQEVQLLGGDLMVNHLGSSQPEDPAFVPPARDPAEHIGSYLRRLEDSIKILVDRRTGGGKVW